MGKRERIEKDRIRRNIFRRGIFAIALDDMGRTALSLQEAKVIMGIWRMAFSFGGQEGWRAAHRKFKAKRKPELLTHDQRIAVSWAMWEAESQGKKNECESLAWLLATRSSFPLGPDKANGEGL